MTPSKIAEVFAKVETTWNRLSVEARKNVFHRVAFDSSGTVDELAKLEWTDLTAAIQERLTEEVAIDIVADEVSNATCVRCQRLLKDHDDEMCYVQVVGDQKVQYFDENSKTVKKPEELGVNPSTTPDQAPPSVTDQGGMTMKKQVVTTA